MPIVFSWNEKWKVKGRSHFVSGQYVCPWEAGYSVGGIWVIWKCPLSFRSQHYLHELVIKTLVQHNLFYMLHQFLQYHVLSDSKPLVGVASLYFVVIENFQCCASNCGHFETVFQACLLLSLESFYPPAHQLSLDMLKVTPGLHSFLPPGYVLCWPRPACLSPLLPATLDCQR